MKGYLNNPEKTALAVQDGWYNTGDIVTVDEDGFITIRDRLSRFSKIGGEMVPHMTIEEVCLEGLGMHEPVVAITSVPDEKKGEQLVLLYEDGKVDIDVLCRVLAESSLPKLYIPKRENIVGIESIPHLGSGKLDMMTSGRSQRSDCPKEKRPQMIPNNAASLRNTIVSLVLLVPMPSIGVLLQWYFFPIWHWGKRFLRSVKQGCWYCLWRGICGWTKAK
jgi:hypothetical protein